MKKFGLKRKNVYIEHNVSFLKTKFSFFNKVQMNSIVDRSVLCPFTYIGYSSFLVNVKIGSFCSIAPKVEIIYGTHPINQVSTHPAFFSTRRQCGTSFVKSNKFQEFNFVPGSTLSAIIGNDVWIGFGAKIIEGITIGDGSIVLAGAYVTKDVEPYSIVGGVPAKRIRYRFEKEQISNLLKFQWWNKDTDWIKDNAEKFFSIEEFMDMIKKQPKI